MATALNNRPYTYTADFALDPDKKVLYAFHEKGTEKLAHIKANPYVSMNWHREFDDNFANVACFQVLGRAEIFDGTSPEFDAGLKVYPYEYAAKARKLTIEQWREIVKKSMIMTRTTIDRIRLTEGALAPMNFRTSQQWQR
jgi:nitroimidazol reductase NimA-like FMN-containing flavoprotein (pyridoxamine 5'-phosphate oxidase superfamily)